jgi:cytoskeletal protein RodZ
MGMNLKKFAPALFLALATFLPLPVMAQSTAAPEKPATSAPASEKDAGKKTKKTKKTTDTSTKSTKDSASTAEPAKDSGTAMKDSTSKKSKHRL